MHSYAKNIVQISVASFKKTKIRRSPQNIYAIAHIVHLAPLAILYRIIKCRYKYRILHTKQTDEANTLPQQTVQMCLRSLKYQNVQI